MKMEIVGSKRGVQSFLKMLYDVLSSLTSDHADLIENFPSLAGFQNGTSLPSVLIGVAATSWQRCAGRISDSLEVFQTP